MRSLLLTTSEITPTAQWWATATLGQSTGITGYTSIPGPTYAPSPVKHVIRVGADGLTYTPSRIIASIGDIVTLLVQVPPKNYTVTSPTLAKRLVKPQPPANQFLAPTETNFATFTITMDDTAPICGVESGPNNFDVFQKLMSIGDHLARDVATLDLEALILDLKEEPAQDISRISRALPHGRSDEPARRRRWSRSQSDRWLLLNLEIITRITGYYNQYQPRLPSRIFQLLHTHSLRRALTFGVEREFRIRAVAGDAGIGLGVWRVACGVTEEGRRTRAIMYDEERGGAGARAGGRKIALSCGDTMCWRPARRRSSLRVRLYVLTMLYAAVYPSITPANEKLLAAMYKYKCTDP
ncbi:hypothetical protein DFH09DRAFT_1435617 [Mycena vulgaris]|nr:hypothetical protein DFH09DRAFT_1435617 [Mycena vulgaris]